MTLIFTIQEEALDCVLALLRANRTYKFGRTVDGAFEITIHE